jgi:hypothetical protein
MLHSGWVVFKIKLDGESIMAMMGSTSEKMYLYQVLSAFRDRGVPKPTSEYAACPSPDGSSAWASAEGGEARRPEPSVREVEVPRPSCYSRKERTQVYNGDVAECYVSSGGRASALGICRCGSWRDLGILLA